jgi:hypothetical protein
VLDDITYAGVATNGNSLMMTSNFVFFMVQNRQQEFGTFSAVLDPPSAVPEPASLALLSGGLLTLAALSPPPWGARRCPSEGLMPRLSIGVAQPPSGSTHAASRPSKPKQNCLKVVDSFRGASA